MSGLGKWPSRTMRGCMTVLGQGDGEALGMVVATVAVAMTKHQSEALLKALPSPSLGHKHYEKQCE